MRCDRAGRLTEASTGSITEKGKKAEAMSGWANSEPVGRQLSPRNPAYQLAEAHIIAQSLQVRVVFEQRFVFISEGD